MRSMVMTGTTMRPHRTPWRRLLQRATARGLAVLREWQRRHRSRLELARFDLRMLRDIGVTPVEAWREINKPFWRE
jgi:uncharacterized protein YjiS (DUF1127 family)